MSTIKRLTRKDSYTFANIGAYAYAGMKITKEEDIKSLGERLWKIDQADPDINAYGLFRKGKLIGGMRMFNFTMKMLSTYIPVGGVGFIAVDLAHKKEHVCKELVEFFINWYAKKKTPLVSLYPFRPDFYRKMGFGYGPKVNEYRIRPAELPSTGDRRKVSFVAKRDYKALGECYHRVVDRTHGMMKKNKTAMGFATRPGTRIAAYRNRNKIEGYITFTPAPTSEQNWLTTEFRTVEFIYETREAMMGLLAFVHSQADQMGTFVLRTQDEDFHYLPHDSRNDSGQLIFPVGHETNTSGIGIMYRIIDTPGLFRALKNHNFNGQSCKLKITVRDTFYPKNAGGYIIHFVNGRPQVKSGGDFEVEINLDVAEYSAVVMGAVAFDRLYEYGLAEISNKSYMDTVTRIFTPLRKPFCVTQF